MEEKKNLKTKYYSMHFKLAVVFALLGLALTVGGLFISTTVIKVISIIVGVCWILIGTYVALVQYFSYFELTTTQLIKSRFKKEKTIDIENISKIDVYSTEYKVYDSSNQLFCSIDRGLVFGEEILNELTERNVKINIKQI